MIIYILIEEYISEETNNIGTLMDYAVCNTKTKAQELMFDYLYNFIEEHIKLNLKYYFVINQNRDAVLIVSEPSFIKQDYQQLLKYLQTNGIYEYQHLYIETRNLNTGLLI